MNYTDFLYFVRNNFLFSFSIILVSFVLGWLLYNHVVTRGICLKTSLFERDNPAAWVEFIGAFIYPTLYLAAKAIEGSTSENIWIDLLTCIIYVICYIALFTVLRLLSSGIVSFINIQDEKGKVKLNSEVYEQKNIAASLFSVVLSTIFVSIIRFMDVIPEYFVVSALKMSSILMFTLAAFIVYSLVLRGKTTLFKEIFIDNNVAAAVSLLGFIVAVELLLTSAVTMQLEFNYAELMFLSLTSLVLFGVLSVLFKFIFTKMIKVDIWNEVYEQNNIGAAIGQVALYVGIANVILHFMK